MNKPKKLYEVWEEGYIITGNSAPAHKRGEVEATSFQEACDILLKDNTDYNSERLTVWGCKLYDNEADARKSFG
jgi:hypothetical protein